MKTITDFITPDFLEEIRQQNEALLYTNVWKTSLGWQQEIVAPTGSVLIRELTDDQKETVKSALMAHQIMDINAMYEFEAQVYLWQRLSFIPWHNDKEEEDTIRYAATLYMNEQWEDDWGGLFLYKDKTGIHAESPTYNKLVFNDQNFPHATSMIASNAPLRQTLQLFWKKN